MSDESWILTWAEILVGLRNLHVDVKCRACMEVFFTGGTSLEHTHPVAVAMEHTCPPSLTPDELEVLRARLRPEGGGRGVKNPAGTEGCAGWGERPPVAPENAVRQFIEGLGGAKAGTLIEIHEVCQECGCVEALQHTEDGLRMRNHARLVGETGRFENQPCHGSGSLWAIVPRDGWAHGPVYSTSNYGYVLGWPGRPPAVEQELRQDAQKRLGKLRDNLPGFEGKARDEGDPDGAALAQAWIRIIQGQIDRLATAIELSERVAP